MKLFDILKKKIAKPKLQKAREPEDVYHALISNVKQEMNLSELVDVFEQICSIPVAVESDMLLYETGTYTFSGELKFYFSLTRQFSDDCEGDFRQLQLNILYEPSERTNKFKDAVWDEEIDGDFFDYVRNSQAYLALLHEKIGKAEVNFEYV